jgi:hypothetical protein
MATKTLNKYFQPRFVVIGPQTTDARSETAARRKLTMKKYIPRSWTNKRSPMTTSKRDS